jgi:cupin fold WbuC family metalloprotein
MKIIDNHLLQKLSDQAKQSSRLRQNYNLHDSYSDPSQRLLNAMEPGSYIRPHRHLGHPKPEGFVAVRGRLALLTFDDQGMVEQVFLMGPNGAVLGVDLPCGVWHTVVSLEEGAVFYETKPGPYQPIQPLDLAPWAPEEGSLGAGVYLEQLKQIIISQVDVPCVTGGDA